MLLELPLDLIGAGVDANEVQCLFFGSESEVIREEGDAATLFTEGELPYQ